MVGASFVVATFPSPKLAYDRSAFNGRLVVLVAEVEATVYGILATTVAMAASVAAVGRRPLARRTSPVSAVSILATVCIFSVVVTCAVGRLLGRPVVVVVVVA